MRAILLVAIAACAPAPKQPPPSPPITPPPAVPQDAPKDAPRNASVALDAAPVPDALGAHGCPATFDANGVACSTPQQVCSYPQGGCICMPHCSGGARPRPLGPGEKPPGPRWECYATPKRTDGCPATLPKGACTGHLTCSYGRLESGLCWGAKVVCSGGQWIGVPVPPPP